MELYTRLFVGLLIVLAAFGIMARLNTLYEWFQNYRAGLSPEQRALEDAENYREGSLW